MRLIISSISEGEGEITKFKELVYNPITANPENEKQKGIVGGQIKDKASWGGHDNHLHIGIDDREIMIAIMNKAKEMGLEVSENPYAFAKKWDTNGMQSHSRTGYHYQNFPGEPKVGKGVDINYGVGTSYDVEKEKLKPFIEWIHSEYGNLPDDRKLKISDIFGYELSGDYLEEPKSVYNKGEEVTQSDVDSVNAGTDYETNLEPKENLEEQIRRVKDLMKKIL